ncbi:hypothetical protein GWK47_053495 [Chionoecetes opilio]|uniref:Uncharacterized protein n=1 Tax=Chionoecetes opilio TaxID=41210 RepID=A0A8J4XZ46_CHIOP|nr:hypothetical protein GWK47_053495 [Chionoecetes opilio]
MLRVLVTVLFAYSDYGSAADLNITCKECVVKENAQALWHKQNRKPTTAVNIKREMDRKLKTPNVTRWNSLYDFMEVLSEPLLEYLLENPHSDKRPKGCKVRFLSLFDQMDFLMATAIHPLFKLPVVRLLNPEEVIAVKSKLLFEVTEQAVLDTSEGSSPDEDEKDDFFRALRSPGPTATEGTNSSRLSNKMRKELESWCSENQRNKLLDQAMFPALFRAAWVDVFVKTTRPYPALQLWIDCSPRGQAS